MISEIGNVFRKYLKYAKYLILPKKVKTFKKIFFEYLNIIVVSSNMDHATSERFIKYSVEA